MESHRERKIVLWALHRSLRSSQGWLELAGKQLQSWPLAVMFCNNSPLVSLILDDFGFDSGSSGMGGARSTPTSSPVDFGVAIDPCLARGSSSSSFSLFLFLLPSLLFFLATSPSFSALAIYRTWRGLICKTSFSGQSFTNCCFPLFRPTMSRFYSVELSVHEYGAQMAI